MAVKTNDFILDYNFEYEDKEIIVSKKNTAIRIDSLTYEQAQSASYKIENGTATSINNAVQLPAELPVLPPGNTTVSYDNTITQLDVLPRWWKI